MKKGPFVMIVTLFLLTSCGGGVDGKKQAERVCDCSKKVMKMDQDDPKRDDAQVECNSITIDADTKLKGNKKQTDIYSKRVIECLSELVPK